MTENKNADIWLNAMNEKAVKCLFCNNDSKYSCPQCSARYCSIDCYRHQLHSECSENFYKEQVLNELKGMRGSTEEKQKIMNILSNIKNENQADLAKNIDGNGHSDISARLADVCIDDVDLVWEKLTPIERDKFQRCVSTGNLGFMPIWTPWWCTEKISNIVEVPEKKDQSRKKLPPIIKDLPQMELLLQTKPPNPNLKFCLIDIILSYVYSQRLFNGDFYDSPLETVSVLLQLSTVLSENKIYSDLATCVHFFVNNIASKPDMTVDPVSVSLEDLKTVIMADEYFMQRAMSDLYSYLKKCRKLLKEENTDLSQELFKVSKKVYFFAVYCRDFEEDIRLLRNDIHEIQHQLLQDREMLNEQKEDIEINLDRLKPNRKSLIEEIV